jgi:preprotein translocase subunit SecG
MLLNILLVILVLDCIALVAVVLLQRSEGGALGMGGGPTGMFTARGAGDLLTRSTWILAWIFFGLSFTITMLSGFNKNSASVTDRLTLDGLTPMTGPAAPAPGQAPGTPGAPPLPNAAPPLPGTAPAPSAVPPLPTSAPRPTAAPRPTPGQQTAPSPATAQPPAIRTQPADPLANASPSRDASSPNQ